MLLEGEREKRKRQIEIQGESLLRRGNKGRLETGNIERNERKSDIK